MARHSQTQAAPRPVPSAAPAGQWTTKGVVLLALAAFIAGIGVGALTRGENPVAVAGSSIPSMPPAAAPAGAVAQTVTAEQLNAIAGPLLTAVKANPKDLGALTQLGNLYYDHKQYREAIDYYRRVADLDPMNPDVLTDLGTAYWYTGSAAEAVAEYDRALAIRPGYANTLMNLGIVRMDGLQDYKGAIAAWKKLLQENPTFAQKDKVEGLIAQAQSKMK